MKWGKEKYRGEKASVRFITSKRRSLLLLHPLALENDRATDGQFDWLAHISSPLLKQKFQSVVTCTDPRVCHRQERQLGISVNAFNVTSMAAAEPRTSPCASTMA